MYMIKKLFGNKLPHPFFYTLSFDILSNFDNFYRRAFWLTQMVMLSAGEFQRLYASDPGVCL